MEEKEIEEIVNKVETLLWEEWPGNMQMEWQECCSKIEETIRLYLHNTTY